MSLNGVGAGDRNTAQKFPLDVLPGTATRALLQQVQQPLQVPRPRPMAPPVRSPLANGRWPVACGVVKERCRM